MGKASGANSTLRQFGGAFGIAVAAAVFAANGHIGTAASFDAGFQPALAVAASLSLLGALTALAVGRAPARRLRTEPNASPARSLGPALATTFGNRAFPVLLDAEESEIIISTSAPKADSSITSSARQGQEVSLS